MKCLRIKGLIFLFTIFSFLVMLRIALNYVDTVNYFPIRPLSIRDINLRMIVIVYDRARSVKRCLHTLNKAEYLGDTVHIDLWIDRSPAGIINEKTYKAVSDFKFLHGSYEVHNHTKHVGLYGQWLSTWQAKADSKEIVLFLEDDVDVSPYFYRYLKAVHEKYDKYPEINGYALHAKSIKHGGDRGYLTPPVGSTVYLYPCLGTWGFSPKAKHWMSFVEWFKNASRKENFKPLVPNNLYSRWYMQYKGKGLNLKVWSMWHIYYAYKHSALTLYSNAYAMSGQGFTVSRNENGLHYKRFARRKVDHVVSSWNKSYILLPDKPVILDIHGHVVSNGKIAWG